MVPKRKKADMALLQEDLPSRRQLEGVQYADYAPAPNPRRSGRVRNSQATSALGDYPDAGKAESKTPSPSPPRRSTRTAKDKGRGREVVEDAMHELQDMEEQLRGAVKRQKLAVKSSSVMTDVNERDPEDAAFLPRPIRNELSVVPPKVKGKPVVEKKGPNSHGELSTFPNPGSALMVEGHAEDPEAAPGSEDINELKLEGARPPPVNSEYLPLPWKGRLGYACLNTYLRSSNPPVFSSRTCRISSILEHRHPLKDVSQPEHATKNRPDKDQPAELALGHKFVQELGLANARDIVKMIRWNDKYGIKFMRLSSEMFPFASHDEYGYKLAPFASKVLAEAGKLAGELGHRLTTHPGQFTQLGSPRAEVVKNAVRDLEYHDEMLSLLRLPEQANRDAVMILHMGGVFGDKAATLDRFRANYAKLSPGIKARLVLENDDVSWTVHDLLPICEELNIPMVLDFHHHNIMFDKDQLREGTQDIMELFPRIKATWDRKGITQKMHYSEPCPEAITGRQRRKHRPRVLTLPPCADNMDLMIEAKDKEQAVFELMRTYRLPGWNLFNDIVPYERDDENRPAPKPKTPKKKPKSKKAAEAEANGDEVEAAEEEPPQPTIVPDEAVGMGGPLNRVYWPMGMEEWLRPKKREVKRKKEKEEEQDES